MSSNVELIKEIYAAFAQGDIPAILNSLSDDVEWRWGTIANLPFAGEYNGPDQVVEFFQGVGESLEIRQFEQDVYIDGGDYVVVLGTIDSIAIPTGKRWADQYVHVWQIRKGQVTGYSQFTDSAAALEAFTR